MTVTNSSTRNNEYESFQSIESKESISDLIVETQTHNNSKGSTSSDLVSEEGVEIFYSYISYLMGLSCCFPCKTLYNLLQPAQEDYSSSYELDAERPQQETDLIGGI